MARYCVACRAATAEAVRDSYRWWAENHKVHPQGANVARTYLSLSVSSAGVERVFSHAGTQITKQRSRLSTSPLASLVIGQLWVRLEGLESSEAADA